MGEQKALFSLSIRLSPQYRLWHWEVEGGLDQLHAGCDLTYVHMCVADGGYFAFTLSRMPSEHA